MKLLNELSLMLENPHWLANTEFALLDTILTMHPEIYELIRNDFSAKIKTRKKRTNTDVEQENARN